MHGLQDDTISTAAIPDTPLIDIEMSPRAYQVLFSAGCNTLRDVAALSRQKLSKQPNCGEVLLAEVDKILRSYGRSLPDMPTPNEKRVRLQKKRAELMRDVRDMDKAIHKLELEGPRRTLAMTEQLARHQKRRKEHMTVVRSLEREIDQLREAAARNPRRQ